MNYKAEAHASHAAKTKRLTGHSDEKADRALVHKMVKPKALTGKAKGGECHANGGPAKHKKAKTQVNVIVPQSPARAVPVPVGPAPGAGPAPMPSRGPAPVAPAGAPMPAAKRGGKIKRASGGSVMKIHGYDAGAGSGEGRIEKEEHMRRHKGR